MNEVHRQAAVLATTLATTHAASSQAPAHAAHSDRGQFGAYVFRLSRAPVQAPPRRAAGLRASPPSAQPQGAAADLELDLAADQQGRRGAARDDGRYLLPVETQTEAQTRGDAHGGDPGQAPPRRPLRARVLPAQERGGTPLHARLLRAGWPGLAGLAEPGDPGDPAGTQRALNLALALQPAAVTRALPASQNAIWMAAVALFLQHDRGRQALATLSHVKRLLLDTRAPTGPGPAVRPMTEREQDANLLRVAHLLNAGRPRTPPQRVAARARLALLGAALQGPASSSPSHREGHP